MMFVARFFFFHLFESPKFLLSRGRQAEAVATVHGIAYKNGRTTWLTEEILNEIGGEVVKPEDLKLSYAEVVKRFFSKFSGERIAPLFATRRLGLMSTSYLFILVSVTFGRLRIPVFPFVTLRMAKKVDILYSMSYLVLLGYYWDGISPL